jgi:hypothetical protein
LRCLLVQLTTATRQNVPYAERSDSVFAFGDYSELADASSLADAPLEAKQARTPMATIQRWRAAGRRSVRAADRARAIAAALSCPTAWCARW